MENKKNQKIPTAKEILDEFERGDFSSVDPLYFKTGHDILEKFLSSQKKKKRQKKAKPDKTSDKISSKDKEAHL